MKKLAVILMCMTVVGCMTTAPRMNQAQQNKVNSIQVSTSDASRPYNILGVITARTFDYPYIPGNDINSCIQCLKLKANQTYGSRADAVIGVKFEDHMSGSHKFGIKASGTVVQYR